jgi:hypothetical protein
MLRDGWIFGCLQSSLEAAVVTCLWRPLTDKSGNSLKSCNPTEVQLDKLTPGWYPNGMSYKYASQLRLKAQMI